MAWRKASLAVLLTCVVASAFGQRVQFNWALMIIDGTGVVGTPAIADPGGGHGLPEAVEAMREQASKRAEAIRLETRDAPSRDKFPFTLAGLSQDKEFALALFFFGPPGQPAKDGSAMWSFGHGYLHVRYDESNRKITSVLVEHSGAAQALKKINITDPTLALIGRHQKDVIAALGKPTRTVGEGMLFWDYEANGSAITATVTCYENDNPYVDGFRKGICYSIGVDWPHRN
jgi:hypothetical protein